MTATPRISVIVIAFRMPRQALNTIRSLSVLQQKNVSERDYEIILVENESPEPINEAELAGLGKNITFYRRRETGTSPAPAINFALGKARAPHVGLLIDGARMVTPRVMEYALMAQTISRDCITAVPGYFIGPCEHQFARQCNYTEADELALLEKIRWQENPYRLFDICTMSAANPRGAFTPFMESNCFFTSMENFRKIGGVDERFNLPGGGPLNLYLFRKLGCLPDCPYYFVLPGEGSFHQLHNGVTTSHTEDRESLVIAFQQQLEAISGMKKFNSMEREPILLGSITSQSQRFLSFASQCGQKRFLRLAERKRKFWPDDIPHARYTEQSL